MLTFDPTRDGWNSLDDEWMLWRARRSREALLKRQRTGAARQTSDRAVPTAAAKPKPNPRRIGFRP